MILPVSPQVHKYSHKIDYQLLFFSALGKVWMSLCSKLYQQDLLYQGLCNPQFNMRKNLLSVGVAHSAPRSRSPWVPAQARCGEKLPTLRGEVPSPVEPTARSLGQQHGHHLGACWKCPHLGR